ncbi:hypothetical protein BCT76_17980 [Vibrio tasmaniensis]|uniref:ATP-grasp domain-containing protein n=1 Tax=Vibrio tasmaniensis TaxID=212663 RepID=UPI000C84FCD3|nr:ATP-grasp domain-containing protein [Vibrio tasmaniensis]PML45368.1 hypothetical protein BCT76_17980 [Vibrio tasmaniensis]
MGIIVLNGMTEVLARAPRYAEIVNVVENSLLDIGAYKLKQQSRNRIEIAVNNIVDFDYTNIVSRFNISRIVSFTERYLVHAARLNDHFGLGGNSIESVETINNKLALRERFDSGRIFFSKVNTNELARLLVEQEPNNKIIVKPLNGTGSKDITLVCCPCAVPEDVVARYSGYDSVLVESYCEGKEFSVESYSWNGKHEIVAITQKIKNSNFVEIGHISPAEVTDEEKLKLSQHVYELLDQTDIQEGPCHTEVILSESGDATTVESHSRTGGDRIVCITEMTTGVDMIERYFFDLFNLHYPESNGTVDFAGSFYPSIPEGYMLNKQLDIPVMSTIYEFDYLVDAGVPVSVPYSSDSRHYRVLVGAASRSDLKTHLLEIERFVIQRCEKVALCG